MAALRHLRTRTGREAWERTGFLAFTFPPATAAGESHFDGMRTSALAASGDTILLLP